MKKKRLVGLVTLLVLLTITMLAFTSCEKEEAKDEGTVLRVMWWGSQNRHDKTIEVIKLFEEKHPGVTVQYEFLGWSGYWQKVGTMAAAGSLPDVVQIAYTHISEYANNGQLVNLDSLVASGAIDMSHVDPSFNSGHIVNDSLYGISLGASSWALVYNPEMFDQAGVPHPYFRWTWDEYIKAATKIQEELGVWGVYDNNSYTQMIYWMMQQEGVTSLFTDDVKSLAYDSPDNLQRIMQQRLDMQESGASVPVEYITSIKSGGMEDYPTCKGEAAMAWLNSNEITAMRNISGLDLRLSPLPHDPNAHNAATITPSMGFSIPTNSKQQELAAEFINFFTNDLEANKILLAERGVPISSKIREGLSDIADEATLMQFEYIEEVTKIAVPFVAYPNAVATEVIRETAPEYLEKVLYKEKDSATVAREYMETANRMLKQ